MLSQMSASSNKNYIFFSTLQFEKTSKSIQMKFIKISKRILAR